MIRSETIKFKKSESKELMKLIKQCTICKKPTTFRCTNYEGKFVHKKCLKAVSRKLLKFAKPHYKNVKKFVKGVEKMLKTDDANLFQGLYKNRFSDVNIALVEKPTDKNCIIKFKEVKNK